MEIEVGKSIPILETGRERDGRGSCLEQNAELWEAPFSSTYTRMFTMAVKAVLKTGQHNSAANQKRLL